MNIGEANAVQTLLGWIVGNPDPYTPPSSYDSARDAALWLSERANKTLMAGLLPEQVRAHWPAPGERSG